MSKLWKKSGITTNPLIEQYTVGTDTIYDMILFPYDIEGTLAHIKGLQKISILSLEETGKIIETLDALLKEYKKGTVVITVEDEDSHTVIENYLSDKLGDLGKKIHIGRSRNDQVLTAIRLYIQDQMAQLLQDGTMLKKAFLHQAKKYQNHPFPGYSHTKQAMLSSLGHYLASFVESLQDDLAYCELTKKFVSKNPLGSAAGFGVNIPLDREFTTKELDLHSMQINSLYCQAGRGKYESLVLESLVQLMLTMSKFGNDMLYFSSDEFDYITFADELTTGSSIMPHKKNLDALEMLRGYTATIMQQQHLIQQLSTRILSGYNRDTQLMKKTLIDSFNVVIESIGIVYLHVQGLVPNTKKITQTMSKKMLLADIATELAQKDGIPFREAYAAASTTKLSVVDFKQELQKKKSLGSAGNLGLEWY